MGMWCASSALSVLCLTVSVQDPGTPPTSRRAGRGTTDFEIPGNPKPVAKPVPREQPRIRTDANGWPIPGKPQTPQEKPRPPKQQPMQPPARPGGAAGGLAEHSPLADRGSLHDVFQQMGQPQDLIDLRCVVAWISLKMFDHRGAELGEILVHHEVDLRARRDRLLFSRPSRGPTKIYGRDGPSVFAEMHEMPWPSLESEAAEETGVFGLLLRMPWLFADSDRFVVKSRDDDYIVNGRAMVRLRVERRPETGGMSRRDGANKPQDRFDLICPKKRMEPAEVHMCLAATGATTVVRLLDYKSFGGVRIPTRRIFLGEDGHRRMEMRITRLDTRLDLPRSQFRPHRR